MKLGYIDGGGQPAYRTYGVLTDGWRVSNQKVGTSRLTISGKVDRTEARAIVRLYELTVQVRATCADASVGTRASLAALYDRVDVGSNALYFEDPDGVVFDPREGTDVPGSHYYDCGVFFEAMESPENYSPLISGSTDNVRFAIPIVLRVAKVL